MLVVISPAKTLDFETPITVEEYSTPIFLKESRALVKQLRELTPLQISQLMGVSDKIAGLNAARFAEWKTPFTPKNARQSLYAFNGPVYTGMAPETFKKRDIAFAQDHLRILSGLYGLLRPLDLLQPYRLEMGTKFENQSGKNLYEFWDDKITKAINEELVSSKHPVLINLASNEYFKSIQAKHIQGEIVTPSFKDRKGADYKMISIYAKRARGLMAAYVIKNRLKKTEDLKDFDCEGYYYSEQHSKGNNFVFLRDQVPA